MRNRIDPDEVLILPRREHTEEWFSFETMNPEPNRNIRVKGYSRIPLGDHYERENVHVDADGQFESLANVIDTHWQYILS